MNSENKNHWYDGHFYDKIIAPNQDKAFKIVKSLIANNSSILDAGCGTGRLVFQCKDKSNKIAGIDLSIKNIKIAKRLLSKNNLPNISFYHADLISYLKNNKVHFDYSVVSYVIHEVDENQREKFIRTLSESSDRIIIVDYLYPRPKSFASILNEAVEFAAGREHYKNYKSYLSNKGIMGIAEITGLKVESEIKNSPLSCHIVVLKK